MALGVDSASNSNEYQEYFLGGKGGRCVWLTTLPPSSADFLEIWEHQLPGTLGVCAGIAVPYYLYILSLQNHDTFQGTKHPRTLN
jgi:hypothetical protein